MWMKLKGEKDDEKRHMHCLCKAMNDSCTSISEASLCNNKTGTAT